MTISVKHTFKDLELSTSKLELVAGGIPEPPGGWLVVQDNYQGLDILNN